jgi:YspA, cpYpsA-related SLOG family
MTDDPRFRLLYTGSRLITARARVYADLDDILSRHPRLLLRYGACREGGDALAVAWARDRQRQGADIFTDPRPAPWPLLGRIAGPMRNGYMVGLGTDGCLAHTREGSTGSAGCATFAEWAGVPVRRVRA